MGQVNTKQTIIRLMNEIQVRGRDSHKEQKHMTYKEVNKLTWPLQNKSPKTRYSQKGTATPNLAGWGGGGACGAIRAAAL